MKTKCLTGFAPSALLAGLVFLAAIPGLAQSPAAADKRSDNPVAGNVDIGPGYPRATPPGIEQLRGDPDIVIVDGVNYPVANSTDGSSINWLTGAICNCDDDPGFHFNPWGSGGNLAFWWWGGTDSRAGLSTDGLTYAVLGEGDTIGPASTFISAGFPAGTVNWRQAGNVDGFLGFRFNNGGTVNYGYARLTTTGTTGFPATIVSYAYNQAGNTITIPAESEIEVSPASFSFTVVAGDTDSDELTIENIGTGTLIWDIELEDATVLGGGGFDPLLDEALDIPDFTVITPANGGTPQVFTIPAGVLTSGLVVGFSFEGMVAGITGNGDWASDLCMQIEGPDGSSFSVGGISATIPNCNVTLWDFNGGGSTSDGTYSSEHLDVWPFPPGAQDDGDWTFTFIHGWNSIAANPMDWSNVTVTLHKVGVPEPCDNPGLVNWLSVDPDAGSAESGAPSLSDIIVDSDGLAVGTYNANLCINSNDSGGNTPIVVPVELEVVPVVDADLSLSMTVTPTMVQAGEAISLEATIANDGPAAAEALSLEVSLPAEISFVSGSLDQGSGTWSCAEAAGLVTCELTAGSLPIDGQAAVLLIELDVALSAAPGNYDLDGEVISGNDTDPDLGNNTASTTLEVVPFAVTASVTAGQGGITPASQAVASGAAASFTVTPDTGWSISAVAGDTCTPTLLAGDQWQAAGIQADCAVEASFVINTYSVTTSVGSGDGAISPANQTIDHGDEALFVVTPDLGWSVTTVTGDTCTPVFDSGEQWIAANITQDCAVTADFAQDTFDVTASVSGGQGDITPPAQVVVFDETASFTVTPDPGWSVDSVTGDTCAPVQVAGNNWEAPNILADCVVEASFVISTYSVTASVGSGDGSISPANQTVDHGDEALFVVTPDPGWSVDSVTGDTCAPVQVAGNNWEAPDILADCVVEASFVINTYSVTASVGSGDGAISPANQTIDHGDEALFVVTPDLGWSVTTVTGDTCTPAFDNGEQWIATNITQDCAVTADFAQDTFDVTASVSSGQGDITPPTQNVVFDETASFTVTPDPGWSVDSVTGDTCAPAQVAGSSWEAPNILEDCAVEAGFVINSYSLGGSVSGLIGSGLVLSLDDEELLPIAGNGPFTFDAELEHGTAWSVSVDSQPSGPVQTCAVSNGSSGGIVGDVDNILIVCSTDTFSIGGSVSGLTAAGLQLDLNGSEALSITAGATSFEFVDPLPDGSNYDVTVASQPPGQWCEVTNGQGQINGEPITDVLVSCGNVGISFSLGEIDFGAVTVGSSPSRVLAISNPGSNPLTIDDISPPGSPFEIIADTCNPLPRTLEAGESCSLEIRFNNQAPGLHTDQLIVSSNADNSPHTIPVRGNGIVPTAIPILSPIGLVLLALIMLILGHRYSQHRQPA